MPVTELAILRTTETTPSLPPHLLSSLSRAKHAMETYSGGPEFFYLRCTEDPTVIYLIGNWPSVEFHMTRWIPSRENQDLLAALEGLVVVDAMFHVDVDQGVTPLPVAEGVEIARFFVRSKGREAFEEGLVKGKGVGGFRIDRERTDTAEERDEFVLFTGWEDGTARDDEVVRYHASVRGCVDGVEIKHARPLRVDDADV